jgi:hypothetical protein
MGKAVSLVTFFAAAKKVTAAPHRGSANKPTRLQAIHETPKQPPQQPPSKNTQPLNFPGEQPIYKAAMRQRSIQRRLKRIHACPITFSALVFPV